MAEEKRARPKVDPRRRRHGRYPQERARARHRRRSPRGRKPPCRASCSAGISSKRSPIPEGKAQKVREGGNNDDRVPRRLRLLRLPRLLKREIQLDDGRLRHEHHLDAPDGLSGGTKKAMQIDVLRLDRSFVNSRGDASQPAREGSTPTSTGTPPTRSSLLPRPQGPFSSLSLSGLKLVRSSARKPASQRANTHTRTHTHQRTSRRPLRPFVCLRERKRPCLPT